MSTPCLKMAYAYLHAIRPWELYNIDEDRCELHNLAQEHPDRLNALMENYEAWARNAGISSGKGQNTRKEKVRKNTP